MAVAEAVGEEPVALPPLYEKLDPDALDVLFRDGSSLRVEFEYAGQIVIVCGDGDVTVRERGTDKCSIGP